MGDKTIEEAMIQLQAEHIALQSKFDNLSASLQRVLSYAQNIDQGAAARLVVIEKQLGIEIPVATPAPAKEEA